jgi:uncharacterized membrane protein
MADLIAIGYDDEETAAKAAEEVYRLAHDLLIEPQAVAVISRDKNGKYKSRSSASTRVFRKRSETWSRRAARRSS